MARLEAIYERVGGLDVHKKSVVACRRRVTASGRVEQEIATFGTTTPQLLALLAWLQAWEVTHVAMESTGVYWKPVWNVLEGHLTLLLVNARHLKTVPGRKTDVKDSAWIAQLMQYGLLRGSFVPSVEVRQWRDLTRQRSKLSDQHTAVVNRIHKVLEDANVKLASVMSDIMGVSGRRIVRAIVAGETDPVALAQLGDTRLRASQERLAESLLGHLTDHHRFLLAGLLEQVAFLEGQIARLDQRLEEQMRPFEAQLQRLDTIDGIDRIGARSLLAELGPDMGVFPDADHLASWAGMSPGQDESAGKRRSGKTTKGNKWLRRTLTQAAWAATRRKQGYLAAQYRRLAGRRGKNRAIVAVGHTILVAAYHILQADVVYRDLGGDYFDRRRRERTVAQLVKRLQRLGYHVTLAETDTGEAA
jgi:transposase